MNRAHVSWPLVATAAVALALGVFAMNPLPIGAFHDDARYLLLARSIANGTGYRFTFVPGEPAGTHFPPAFPLLLAALWRVAPAFPASEGWFKVLNAVMLSVAGVATFAFARSRARLGAWAAAGVAIASVGSVPILFLDGVLFSEPFFIAALLGALMLADQLVDRVTQSGDATHVANAPSRALDLFAFATGLAIGGVAMIRTLGIALGLGLAIVLLVRRRWRPFAAAMGGIAVIVVPWQLWTMRHGGEIPSILSGDYGTYGSWVAAALHTEGSGFIARVAWANLHGFGIMLDLFGVGSAGTTLRALVALVLLTGVAIGTRRLARVAPVSVASTAAYLLVVLIWPGTPDRFLWPVWPVLLTALACGAAELLAWHAPPSRRVMRAGLLLALGVCGLCFVGWNLGEYRARSWEGPARANAKLATADAEAATQLPDGLVASEFDALVSLYTGHRAVPLLPLMAANYLRERTPAEAAGQLSDILDAYHPRFLLVGSGEALRAASLLAHAPKPRIKFSGVTPSGVLLYRSLP